MRIIITALLSVSFLFSSQHSTHATKQCHIRVGSNRNYKTIQDGVDAAISDQTICVDSGTYTEHVVVSKDNLTLYSNPQDRAIVDGQDKYPTGGNNPDYNSSGLVFIQANNVTLEGFKITNSHGIGIKVSLDQATQRYKNIQILNNYIFKNKKQGITPHQIDNILIQGNILELSSTKNLPPINETGGAQINPKDCDGVIIKNNVIRYGLSEGIITDANHGESRNIEVIDNIFHDNDRADIYSHGSRFTNIQKNLVFRSGMNPYFHTGIPDGACNSFHAIEEGDHEKISGNPPNYTFNDITAKNNIFWGCDIGIKFGAGTSVLTYKDVNISHNTIVSTSHKSNKSYTGIWLNSLKGLTYDNINISNNIFYKYGSIDYIPLNLHGNKFNGVKLFGNIWTHPNVIPNSHLDLSRDKDGVDVDLVGQDGNGKFESLTTSDRPQNEDGYTALYQEIRNWFKLKSNSTSINTATDSDEKIDHWNSPRDNQPDVGAHEFGSTPTTPKPQKWDLNHDNSINILDFSHLIFEFTSKYSFPNLSQFSSAL